MFRLPFLRLPRLFLRKPAQFFASALQPFRLCLCLPSTARLFQRRARRLRMAIFPGEKSLQAGAFALWIVWGAFCGFVTPAAAADTQVEKELTRMVELYRQSVIHADDIRLAEQVWLTGAGVSFIHPRGHERGWEEIKNNFYRKTMSETFSGRDLRLAGAPVVRLYGRTAVVEFDWEFHCRAPKGWKPPTEQRDAKVTFM